VKIFLQIFTLGSRPGTPRRGYSETPEWWHLFQKCKKLRSRRNRLGMYTLPVVRIIYIMTRRIFFVNVS